MLTVGKTTVSPSWRPLTISVEELPTRPTWTRWVAVFPFWSSSTVDDCPVVVIAALGRSSTLPLDWTTTLTLAVIPSFTSDGGLISEIVASYVTTLLTTVEVLETAITFPATLVFGRAEKVTVAGSPTASFVASASANPETTCSLSSESIVMNPDELDDDVLLPVVAADPAAPAP